MEDIFVTTLITEKLKVKPKFICQDVSGLLEKHLRVRFEGKCSHHGYIKPMSIHIYKHSMGKIMDVSLNGDVIYNVQFYASVCNPAVGSVLRAKVVNMNNFGILAECSINVNNENIPILEIIVARNGVDSIPNLEDIKVNDVITIEVLGKKFELNDKKIAVVGKIITGANLNVGVDGANDNEDDGDENHDIDTDVDNSSSSGDDKSSSEEEDESEAEDSEQEDHEDDKSSSSHDDDAEEAFGSESSFFSGSDNESIASDNDNDLNDNPYR